MSNKITTAIWLGCILGASAGQLEQDYSTSSGSLGAEFPDIDVARANFTYSDEMDFDNIGGSLSVTEFNLFTLLSRPIPMAGGVLVVPALQYGYTDLEFDGTGANFPMSDDGLHSLSLHLAAVKMQEGSPWFYGGWGRVELATDFEDVGGDAFTFDIAGGVGYRVNDSLTVAGGVALLNFNGDFWILPGINFDWKVNEQLRVGLYGPMPIITYTPSADWSLSLRGSPGGGTWNIEDKDGASKALDLASYQVGAYVGRRLTGSLWLNGGVGVTTFNNLELTEPDGDHGTFDEDMEWGFFGQIGLSMKVW